MLGNDLLSHRVAPTVPSALEGLTSVFGKGTGVSPSLSSPEHSDDPDLLTDRTKIASQPLPGGAQRNNSRCADGEENTHEVARLISTRRLSASPRVHREPINLVISEESLGLSTGDLILG